MENELHEQDEAPEAEPTETPGGRAPGMLNGKMAPVGARALALAGFVALCLGPSTIIGTRTSITWP
jgi:hypothetical protein